MEDDNGNGNNSNCTPTVNKEIKSEPVVKDSKAVKGPRKKNKNPALSCIQ